MKKARKELRLALAEREDEPLAGILWAWLRVSVGLVSPEDRAWLPTKATDQVGQPVQQHKHQVPSRSTAQQHT